MVRLKDVQGRIYRFKSESECLELGILTPVIQDIMRCFPVVYRDYEYSYLGDSQNDGLMMKYLLLLAGEVSIHCARQTRTFGGRAGLAFPISFDTLQKFLGQRLLD
jgi:hypothetical protein